MTRFSMLVIAAMAAVVLFAAPAGQAAVDVSRFPVSFSLFDPCTNENVDFSGNAMAAVDTTPGDNHFIFHSVDIHVTGVGETSGLRYIETFSIAVALQGNDVDGPYAETNSIHSRLITPGGGNDFVFEIVFHFTITANGDVPVFHNRVTGACV
jgi:hypothetical protein